MEDLKIRKLTEEEKHKIEKVINSIFIENIPEDKTEYDLEVRKGIYAFLEHLLEDNSPYQIEALLDLCNEYLEKMNDNDPGFVELAFIVMYDMWINKSNIWPVPYNPEWEKDKKLMNRFNEIRKIAAVLF